MKKYKGGCLCGKVSFEITGDIQDIVYCHCSQCRKAQGSAFATNGNVELENFTFISGENELTKGQTKYFCKHCGSPIMSRNTVYPQYVRVRLGTIESEIMEKAFAHIFVASKANWEEINDNLPKYDGYRTLKQ